VRRILATDVQRRILIGELVERVASLSRSALLEGSMATENEGGGKSIGSYRMTASLSQSVALVVVASASGPRRCRPRRPHR